MYADGRFFLFRTRHVRIVRNHRNRIDYFKKWFNYNKLTLNETTTKFVVFRGASNICEIAVCQGHKQRPNSQDECDHKCKAWTDGSHGWCIQG